MDGPVIFPEEIESRNHILIKRPKLRKTEVLLDVVVPFRC